MTLSAGSQDPPSHDDPSGGALTMVNRTGAYRSVMVIIASLTLAASACGAPTTTGPAGPTADPNSLDQNATPTPQGEGANGSLGTGGGGAGGGSGTDASGGGDSGGDNGGGDSGGGDSGGGGGETAQPTSAANCLYGKWKQQTGTWTLPGTSWGLSGTVTVNFASSTTNTQQNVILFERNADVGRNVYTEDLEANYMQGYGNPQPSLTLSGRDYGDFSVSGSTVTFSNGSTITMTYRMDTNPVSTKNVKRLVTSAQFSCSSTTLDISSSQFKATYNRLY